MAGERDADRQRRRLRPARSRDAHGDWWSVRGWWIFVGNCGRLAALEVRAQWRGEHIFNPSNIGLVICFLALGRRRAEPLDFWWGPMSWWLALALVIIVTGGFAILARLELLRVARRFWVAFALGIGGLALAGHAMTARWHLGPDHGLLVLVGARHLARGARLLLLHDHRPEDGPARAAGADRLRGRARGARVDADRADDDRVRGEGGAARLARDRLRRLGGAAGRARARRARRLASPRPPASPRTPRRRRSRARRAVDRSPRRCPPGKLPPIAILPSPGVQTQLDRRDGRADRARPARRPAPRQPASAADLLEPGDDQVPPTAVAQLGGAHLPAAPHGRDGAWTLAVAPQPRGRAVPVDERARRARLTDVARRSGSTSSRARSGSGCRTRRR